MKPDFAGPYKVAADWLAANGIDELIPRNPEITITLHPDGTGTITHSAYRWIGERGWDDNAVDWDGSVDPDGDTHTVPLVVMPSEEVRRALDFTECMVMVVNADSPLAAP